MSEKLGDPKQWGFICTSCWRLCEDGCQVERREPAVNASWWVCPDCGMEDLRDLTISTTIDGLKEVLRMVRASGMSKGAKAETAGWVEAAELFLEK